MTKTSDVLVIGGGIIGATCAWRLCQAGLSVGLIEKDEPGEAASKAALGILSFHKRPSLPEPMQRLCSESQNYFPAIIEELAEAVGERVNYRSNGQLHLAIDEDDREELEALLALNHDDATAAEYLTPEEAVRLESAINPAIVGGVYFPNDAWVDNRELTRAVLRAAEACAVEIVQDEVLEIRTKRGQVREIRCHSEKYSADTYILAAGAWSGRIDGVPPLAVEPVRGQALAVAGLPVSRVVGSARGLLAPKGNGETMIGATLENVGFDASNSIQGLMRVLEAAFEISPELTRFKFLEAWAGLRPGTPDDLPAIGPFEEAANLIAATGHFRNGILLSPLTASIVRGLVLDESSDLDLAPFSPDREAITASALNR